MQRKQGLNIELSGFWPRVFWRPHIWQVYEVYGIGWGDCPKLGISLTKRKQMVFPCSPLPKGIRWRNRPQFHTARCFGFAQSQVSSDHLFEPRGNELSRLCHSMQSLKKLMQARTSDWLIQEARTSRTSIPSHSSLPSAALRKAAATASAEVMPDGNQELKLRHAAGAKELAPPEGPQKNSSSARRKRKTLESLEFHRKHQK